MKRSRHIFLKIIYIFILVIVLCLPAVIIQANEPTLIPDVWVELNCPGDCTALTLSPNFTVDKTIFVGSIGGIYKSVDEGLSWDFSVIPQNETVSTIAISPYFRTDDTLFIGTGRPQWSGDGVSFESKIYKSTDGGVSWLPICLPSMIYPRVEVTQIVLSPNYLVDHTILVGGRFPISDILALTMVLAKSTDEGQNWQWILSGNDYNGNNYNDRIECVAFSPNFENDLIIIIGSSDGFVLKSADAGNTWRNCLNVVNSYSIAFSPTFITDKTVFGGDLYISLDSGETWQESRNGFIITDVQKIVYSPNYDSDSTIFVSTGGDSVWISTDRGVNWRLMNPNIFNFWSNSLAVSPNFINDHSLYMGSSGGKVLKYVITGPVSNTPIGNEVICDLGNSSKIEYETTLTTGVTTISSLKSDLVTPASFQVVGAFYDISTTAEYSGTLNITLHFDPQFDPSKVRMYHFNGLNWIDITVSVDPIKYTITGITDSFSYFAVGTPVNSAPEIASINLPINPIEIANPVFSIASFTDADANDFHNAAWEWGDGETSMGYVNETNKTIEGSHLYALPGVYSIKLKITDSGSLSDAEIGEYVVVYNPSGGFITGGGWIYSPEGAYFVNPDLAGKATFGFVSKYNKGTIKPYGNTEFQFKSGDLSFKSASYDWLVIAGAKAQYKGVGSINGAGSYRFILTAVDGQLSGGGGLDKFRLKIWGDNGIIYDNQLNALDNSDPTTVLGGGNIIIHKS
jgi:photosystem II stability/assembly factor-like uncharacterized protein